MPGLRVIIGYNIFIALLFLSIILLDDNSGETIFQLIQLFVAVYVAYGLFDRDEFARKATVVLYSIALVIDFLRVFVGIPYVLFYTEANTSIDIVSTLLLISAFAMSMFTVFYLINPDVKEAYSSNN